jgi:hypothetical protein
MTAPIEQMIETPEENIEQPAPEPSTQKVITDATKIADLTVGELKAIMWELLDKAIFMIEQQLPDPDEGKELKPEIAAYLLQPKENKGPFISLEDLKREMTLDE